MSRARADRASAEALRQAALCLQRGEWARGEGICRFLLEESPRHARTLELLAELCFAQGRAEEALAAYDQAREASPADPDLLYNRAVVLAALGRHEEALSGFEQVLARSPHHVAALVNRGNALQGLGRFTEALASFDRAIALDARSAAAHYNRGNALRELSRDSDALAAFERALALQPDHSGALLNRGQALAALGRGGEALACYDRLLELQPGRVDAHYNRGNVLRSLERDAEAVAAYDSALALDPQHADAHWNCAWALLALGEYERGWREYEWRTKSDRWRGPPVRSSAVRWLGEPDARDRVLLVLAEQGVGDTLQFLRYVAPLAQRAGRVVLELPRSLARLCAGYREWATVVLEDEEVPRHDLQCPIASLPLAFGTTLQTIPGNGPYIHADPAAVEAWRKALGHSRVPGALRVGLVWAGNPRQASEPRRGIGLEACLPLFEVPGIEWYSLQVGDRAGDLARLAPGAAVDLSPRLADFADTAAAIANLDLVISTDTAVAHLAGAMGRKVWIVLMFAADWRWLRGRDDSPWYPGARLFRQRRAGDWAEVIARLKPALAQLAGEHRP